MQSLHGRLYATKPIITMRDNFSKNTIDTLAKRVGNRCSNPNCRQLTSGPQLAPDKIINIGEAAHITAASPDGPRYDPSMTSEQRKSVENGIWLCSKCAKLIDSDIQFYTVNLIKEWKRVSEYAASLEIQGKPSVGKSDREKDINLIRFYSQCLDRPAFKDLFLRERQVYPAFDKAIEDTITAINTGCLRSRDGAILSKAKGKSYLVNREWREKMDLIVDLLGAIRYRYKDIHQVKTHHDFIRLGEWMDLTREQIMQIFSEICEEAGIPALKWPNHHE